MLRDIGNKLVAQHDLLKKWKDNIFEPVVRILPRRVTPNLVTLFRFIVVLIWLPIAYYQPRPIQSLLFFFGYFFDLLDGAVARLRDQVTYFGEKFDAVSDRFNHIALYFVVWDWFHGQVLILKLFIYCELFFILIIIIEYFFKSKKYSDLRTLVQFCVKFSLWIALIIEIVEVYG